MATTGMTELQARRKELGLNQRQLAMQAGVDEGEVSRWERFEREPRGADRVRYAAALLWSVEQLGAVIYRHSASRAPATTTTQGA